MNDVDLDELRAWAREAGATARRYFNNSAARRKADRTWVTEADVAIERELVERISARYPQHGIIAEEQTRFGIDNEFLWALDPLDGTGSFVDGLPIWGVSLGLLRAGEPYLGVIYLPMLDDCYWCDAGGPAFLNEHPIQTLSPRAWDSQDWISGPSNLHRRFTIGFPGKVRSLGCIAASLAYVARGSAIGALITRGAIWDLAAGMAILRAAGGVAIGLSGQPLDTAAMRDGRLLPEPIVVGAPGAAESLRGLIQVRR